MAIRHIAFSRNGLSSPHTRTRGGAEGTIHTAGRAVYAIVFLLVLVGPQRRDATAGRRENVNIYDVFVGRYSVMYHPRIYKGVLATDGTMCRIAFYWLHPASECEIMDKLALSDFLLTHSHVYCCWHGSGHRGHVVLPSSLAPKHKWYLHGNSGLESLIETVFSIVGQDALGPSPREVHQDMIEFFGQAKDRGQYSHIVAAPPVPESATLQSRHWDGFDVLNHLPFGRLYRKDADDDSGTALWSMSKATVPRKLVDVYVVPRRWSDASEYSNLFDPNTLDQWLAVPAVYRKYWSFHERAMNIRRSDATAMDARELHADILSCLHGSVPSDVALALRKLCFRISLVTDSNEVIASAARTYFNDYVSGSQEPVDRIVVELGRIAKHLQERWSDDETRVFILAMLKPLISPNVFADPGFMKDAIIDPICVHGWLWYAQLVLDAVDDIGCLDPGVVTGLRQQTTAYRQSKTVTDSCPVTLSPSAKRLLLHHGDLPPQGSLSFDELARLITDTLLKSSPPDTTAASERTAFGVRERIRGFVGNGPFMGDPARLGPAMSAFVRRYRSLGISEDQTSNMLATLLALSFYDTSEEQDHRLLASQLIEISGTLHEQVRNILGAHGCREAITEPWLAETFEEGTATLCELIGDPLWPMFKFPLSQQEFVTMESQLKNELQRIASAAELVSSETRTGEHPPSLHILNSRILLLTQRIPAGLMRLRSPRGRITLSGSTQRLPVMTMSGHANEPLAATPRTITQMKYFYLGHRTHALTPDDRPSPANGASILAD